MQELGTYKHDGKGDAMILGQPCHLKNISSSDKLQDNGLGGEGDDTPDYRVFVRGPKTVTQTMRDKIQRGKASETELATYAAVQVAKKERPMKFKLILFGPAMPGLIPKMYEGRQGGGVLINTANRLTSYCHGP